MMHILVKYLNISTFLFYSFWILNLYSQVKVTKQLSCGSFQGSMLLFFLTLNCLNHL